jgi:hypothetical protein
MDDHQYGIRREHAHGDFVYFVVRFAVNNSCENGAVKDMGGFLEADAMLRLVCSILVCIPSKFIGIYTAYIYSSKRARRCRLAGLKEEILHFLGACAKAVELGRSTGAEALALPTDLGDDDQVRRLIEGSVGRYGHLDILVNSAMGPTQIDDTFWGPRGV